MLQRSEEKINAGYFDNFSEILSVYKEPNEKSVQDEAANLDSIIAKANVIVNEKNQSDYVDDAYFVVAQANFLKANFFNAIEFFNYLYRTYPTEKGLKQAASALKIRAQMQLGLFAEAKETLDTALAGANPKFKSTSDVYASAAQYFIKMDNPAKAIDLLEKALKSDGRKQTKIRRRFILAQLQEKTGKLPEAYANYRAVAKSNAPFEMAFNANLSRIQIEEKAKEKAGNKIDRLIDLLDDDKNKEFVDQIYFRIGNLHEANRQVEQAVENYSKAIRVSKSNQSQKGLAYLRLAEINLKNADYASAKKYYDSTLTNLPSSYIEYDNIRKKSANLDLLADRLKTIASETTLQELAKLSDPEREKRIGELVREESRKAFTGSAISVASKSAKSAITEVKFYFNNTAAISQGLVDFNRRWGQGRLEDNWRRSSKTAADVTAINLSNPDDPSGTATPKPASGNVVPTGNNFQNIPITPVQLQQSNARIINAYYDIANFYKDELKDYEEAIKTFEELLQRYPENKFQAPIYYNLYRLYAEKNASKSQEYRDLILNKHPQSTFAKAIKDPGSLIGNEKGKELNNAYNEVYSQYLNKNYGTIIGQTKEIENKFGTTNLSGQLAYLNALAIGRTQNLQAFEEALTGIASQYQADSIIAPLVKQHLQYIANNRTKLAGRTMAIIDNDPTEEKYLEEPVQQPTQTTASGNTISRPENRTAVKQEIPNNPANLSRSDPDSKTDVVPETPVNNFFALPDSAEYYFVFNVGDAGTNLSSSRFGIGQFNRANFSGASIKHQLKNIANEHQLIYIGAFISKAAVRSYEERISLQLNNIMKISSDKYNTFAITKEGLDRLNNTTMLNAYLEFYNKGK